MVSSSNFVAEDLAIYPDIKLLGTPRKRHRKKWFKAFISSGYKVLKLFRRNLLRFWPVAHMQLARVHMESAFYMCAWRTHSYEKGILARLGTGACNHWMVAGASDDAGFLHIWLKCGLQAHADASVRMRAAGCVGQLQAGLRWCTCWRNFRQNI